MKTIVIINAEKYAEIVRTLEVVLDRKFEDASIATLIRAVDERIGELEGAAKQADQSGALALEIRVLEEQLQNLASLGGSPN